MEKTNKQNQTEKNQKASKTIYISVINEKLEEFFSLVSVSTYYLHLQTSEVFTFSLWTKPLVKNFSCYQVMHPSLKEKVPTASLPWKVSMALNEGARLVLTPAQCGGAECGGG